MTGCDGPLCRQCRRLPRVTRLLHSVWSEHCSCSTFPARVLHLVDCLPDCFLLLKDTTCVCVCVCVRVRARAFLCVCVCVCVRERERERGGERVLGRDVTIQALCLCFCHPDSPTAFATDDCFLLPLSLIVAYEISNDCFCFVLQY